MATKSKKVPIKLILSMKQGDTYASEGKTVPEALANLGNPVLLKLKTFGTFLIKKDGKQAEMTMRPIQIKRLLSKYSSSFVKDMFEKRILINLK